MEVRNKMKEHRPGEVLSRFFEPRSVAIFGSFRQGFFGGYVIVRSLQNAGYRGRICPVNPGYREVLGLRVYGSIEEVEGEVDLAILMINAKGVLGVIEACAQKGVKAIVVVADGFAERDAEGAVLQRQMVARARELGIRIIGPNTAGVLNTANGFNPCPYEAGYHRIRPGRIALCAQTGMINPQAFPYRDLHLGVSKICDLGNKSDISECEVLEYLAGDPDTGVVALYVESLPDGGRFLEEAARASEAKPVLVLKSGRTEAGARASASHTGSLAVDDRIFEGLCAQAGLLRLETFHELFEIPKIFAAQPLPRGNRMGIFSVTGGVAVMAIDRAAHYGLRIEQLGEGAREALDRVHPGTGAMPVDIGPMMAAVKDAFILYPDLVETVAADHNVDMLFMVLWANPAEGIVGTYRAAYDRLRAVGKPVATWVYGPSTEARTALTLELEDMGFPVFQTPESAVKALGFAWRYAERARAREMTL